MARLSPYEVMCGLLAALEKTPDVLPGVEAAGSGAFIVEPYTADFDLKIGTQRFSVKVDLVGDQSEAPAPSKENAA